MFGRKRRLVLLWAWLTLLPAWTPFLVKSQRRALSERLERRDPDWLKVIQEKYGDDPPRPHPLFKVVEGDIEPWETGYWNAQKATG
jgi:hypothetical protein